MVVEMEQSRQFHIMDVESIILCFLKSEVCYNEQAMLLLMTLSFPTLQLQLCLKENTDKKKNLCSACNSLFNARGRDTVESKEDNNVSEKSPNDEKIQVD